MSFDAWRGIFDPGMEVNIPGSSVQVGTDPNTGAYAVTYATGSQAAQMSASATGTQTVGALKPWVMIAIVFGIILLAAGGLSRRL
jgi:hypothetical protein